MDPLTSPDMKGVPTSPPNCRATSVVVGIVRSRRQVVGPARGDVLLLAATQLLRPRAGPAEVPAVERDGRVDGELLSVVRAEMAHRRDEVVARQVVDAAHRDQG